MDFCLLTGKKKGVTGLLSKRCSVAWCSHGDHVAHVEWWYDGSLGCTNLCRRFLQAPGQVPRCQLRQLTVKPRTWANGLWILQILSMDSFWITVSIISSPSKFVEGHVERIPLPNYFLAVISPERHEVLIVSRASLRLENLSNLLIFKSNNPNSKWQSL